ncbi:MAG: hypothetical protein AAF581_01790 [Planctomycetota bacterium]
MSVRHDWRNRIGVEWVLFAFTAAVPLFAAAGYAICRFVAPLSAQHWRWLLVGTLCAVAVLAAWRRVLPPSEDRATRRCAVAALVTLPLLLWVVYGIVKAGTVVGGGHAPFHVGYVHQIVQGHCPPENPIFSGHPANFYWLYHTLPAVIVDTFGVSVLFANACLSACAFLLTLYWAGRLVLVFRPDVSGWSLGLLALAVLFSGNLAAAAFAVVSGQYPLGALFGFSEEARLGATLQSMRWGGHLTVQLTSLVHKYLLFSGVPLGLLYYVFGLFVLCRGLANHIRLLDFALLAIAIAGGIAFHSLTGFVMVTVLLPAALFVVVWFGAREGLGALSQWWLTSLRELRQGTRLDRSTSIVIAGSTMLLTLSIVHYAMSISSAAPSLMSWNDGTYLAQDIVNIALTGGLMLPLAALCTLQAFRTHNRALAFCGVAMLLAFIGGCLLHIEIRNEYKFVYLGVVAGSVASTAVLARWLQRDAAMWSRCCAIALLALLVVQVLVVASSRLGGPPRDWQSPQLTVAETGPELARVYVWIRENTGSDMAVVSPPGNRDLDMAAWLTERRQFVREDQQFAGLHLEYDARWDALVRLFDDESTIEEKLTALDEILDSSAAPSLAVILPSALSRAPQFAALDLEQRRLRRVRVGETLDVFVRND